MKHLTEWMSPAIRAELSPMTATEQRAVYEVKIYYGPHLAVEWLRAHRAEAARQQEIAALEQAIERLRAKQRAAYRKEVTRAAPWVVRSGGLFQERPVRLPAVLGEAR